MQLYYYKSRLGNVGDDLNSWMWDLLLPGFYDNDESTRFSCIGTIINSDMPDTSKWVVFTSGVGYGFPPRSFGNSSWDIVSVRGPLSAKVLNLPKHKYITDGAALLSTIGCLRPLGEMERSGVIFIPHHKALDHGKWEEVCNAAGVTYVSPRGDSHEIIQKIRHAKLVLADAMHGAIIADALRVPWVPIVTSSEISTFKWLDWLKTIKCIYVPSVLGGDALKNLLLRNGVKVFGTAVQPDDRDTEYAFEHFKRVQELNSASGLTYYRKWLSALPHRLPKKILSVQEKKRNRSWDVQMVETVASKLFEAKSRTGYLSEDSIFSENVELLQNKLNEIKNKYKPI